MARKTEEKTIDGVRYRVTQLGARDARKIELRVLRLSTALAPLAIRGAHGVEGAAAVAGAIAAQLTDEDYRVVVDLLASQSMFSPGEGRWLPLAESYDEHFAGASLRHMRWLWFAIEVNFADFIGALSLGDRAGAPAAPSA